MTYSADFRAQVIKSIKQKNMSIRQACTFYNISKTTLQRWLKNSSIKQTRSKLPTKIHDELLDLLHKSLLALDTLLAEVNKTVLLQEVYYSQGKAISIHNVLLILIFLACCAYADRGCKKFIPAVP